MIKIVRFYVITILELKCCLKSSSFKGTFEDKAHPDYLVINLENILVSKTRQKGLFLWQ